MIYVSFEDMIYAIAICTLLAIIVGTFIVDYSKYYHGTRLHQKYIDGAYLRLLELWLVTDAESLNKFIEKYKIDLLYFRNDSFYIDYKNYHLTIHEKMDSLCVNIRDLELADPGQTYTLNPCCKYEYLEDNKYSDALIYILKSLYY